MIDQIIMISEGKYSKSGEREFSDFRPESLTKIHNDFLKKVDYGFRRFGERLQIAHSLPNNSYADYMGNIARIAIYGILAEHAHGLSAAFKDAATDKSVKASIDSIVALATDGESTLQNVERFLLQEDYRQKVIGVSKSYFDRTPA